jgi:hypothetical protein
MLSPVSRIGAEQDAGPGALEVVNVVRSLELGNECVSELGKLREKQGRIVATSEPVQLTVENDDGKVAWLSHFLWGSHGREDGSTEGESLLLS